MAGRTPREAVHNFVTPLQQAISCVTGEILTVEGGYYPSPTPHKLALSTSPAALGRDKRFALTIAQEYLVVTATEPHAPWKVQTVAYLYTVYDAGEEPREVIGYHLASPWA
jgi:hypothetical protein